MLLCLIRKAVVLVRVCFKKNGAIHEHSEVLENPLPGELIKGGLMPRRSKRGPKQELRLISSLTRTPFPQGYVNAAGRDSSGNSPSCGWRQALLCQCSGVLCRGTRGAVLTALTVKALENPLLVKGVLNCCMSKLHSSFWTSVRFIKPFSKEGQSCFEHSQDLVLLFHFKFSVFKENARTVVSNHN